MQRWKVLATDYDGTLARHGTVPAVASDALARYREAGGVVVLVTGRRHEEFDDVYPAVLREVDLVVAENGGLLVDPASRRTLLGAPLPHDVDAVLEDAGVPLFETGEVIVSAARTDEPAVRRAAALLEARWPCDVVPNKDRVMLLPRGVDKGTGLRAALALMGLDAGDVVGIGDAENDLPLLAASGMGVAVANAVESLLAAADHVAGAPGPLGVVETLEMLLRG